MKPLSRLLQAPALIPLQNRVYRGLWLAWLMANMTMWIHDVTAGWRMVQLTDSTVMVALVQTASTLPVFLLGIASGALADIVDRRRYFAATQLWVCVTAVLLAGLELAGALTAPLLLLLTFVNGIGLALRWPVFSAIVPEVLRREELPAGLALSSISMNLSRIAGPLLAGALLAMAAPALVFALNALLAGAGLWLILRWKSAQRASTLPGERFLGAMRVGLQHVWQSPRMRVVVVRAFLFFLQSSALVALLPLIAHRTGGGAAMFTAMMASMGAGAIVAALQFPRWRQRFGRDAFVRYGTVAHALVSAGIVIVPTPWFALPAMALAGAAWISTANTLVMSAQLALPDWVRARGMSIYQVALMGGTAVGAWLWGHVADVSSVPAAVVAASVSGLAFLLLTLRHSVEQGGDEDFTPRQARPAPAVAVDVKPDEGPVMVEVEYHIDPARAADFAEVMQATRCARLRQGVLSWELFRDTTQPGRYVEHFIDESWVAHHRWLERFSAADDMLRSQRLAFHLGDRPPRIRRYVAALAPSVER
ncbi:MFS transporter [uncultured Azohydromonas sp.]|jgi:Arabinose efflux permease|uniref:MFS transporter n=1 Tax=uncultured Azohydromonas sp. TaxID=487342 RepID=UPI00261B1C12|nr:MFS transporter [uncultured Azohydromonas sp.]